MTQTSIKVRNGYKIDLPDGESCFWFEMDHPRERVPDFQTIFDYYIVKHHWATWIKPGMTVIDNWWAQRRYCYSNDVTMSCNSIDS